MPTLSFCTILLLKLFQTWCVTLKVSLANLKYCFSFRVDFETPFLCARRSRHAFLHFHSPPGCPSQPGCSQFPQHTCPWRWVSRASGLGKLTRLGHPVLVWALVGGVDAVSLPDIIVCTFAAYSRRLSIFWKEFVYMWIWKRDRFLPRTFAYSIFRFHLQYKKCWIAETKIGEHVAHIGVSARRPICRAHILVWFALSRARDIWHLHMWLSTVTILVRKPETHSKCTAGWLFLREGREDLSLKLGTIELWWDCFASGPEKKRGPFLSNCLQITDLTFRLINLHKFYMVQKKPWGQYVNLWLVFQQKALMRSFFWLSPNFSAERKLAVSQP